MRSRLWSAILIFTLAFQATHISLGAPNNHANEFNLLQDQKLRDSVRITLITATSIAAITAVALLLWAADSERHIGWCDRPHWDWSSHLNCWTQDPGAYPYKPNCPHFFHDWQNPPVYFCAHQTEKQLQEKAHYLADKDTALELAWKIPLGIIAAPTTFLISIAAVYLIGKNTIAFVTFVKDKGSLWLLDARGRLVRGDLGVLNSGNDLESGLLTSARE